MKYIKQRLSRVVSAVAFASAVSCVPKIEPAMPARTAMPAETKTCQIEDVETNTCLSMEGKSEDKKEPEMTSDEQSYDENCLSSVGRQFIATIGTDLNQYFKTDHTQRIRNIDEEGVTLEDGEKTKYGQVVGEFILTLEFEKIDGKRYVKVTQGDPQGFCFGTVGRDDETLDELKRFSDECKDEVGPIVCMASKMRDLKHRDMDKKIQKLTEECKGKPDPQECVMSRLLE